MNHYKANNQQGFLSRFGISEQLSAGIAAILFFSVLLAAIPFYFYEKERYFVDIRKQAEEIISTIEVFHANAMLNRGLTEDHLPIIDTFNNSLSYIRSIFPDTRIWVVMGPKVEKYQLQHGHKEIERPIDQIDRRVLETAKPIWEVTPDNFFRYSVPVVLGEGLASNKKCQVCHSEKMGIMPGEVIGAFSYSRDISAHNAYLEHIFLIAFSITILFATIFAISTWIFVRTIYGKPIASIADALKRLSVNEKGVELPASTQFGSRELRALVDAAKVFRQSSDNQVTEIFRALDEHALVSITDVKGNITHANQKFCEISGYSLDELIGQNHRILNSGEHSKEFFKDLWRTISRGDVWHGEIKNRRKSGSYYWVAATIVPFLKDDGKPYQYVAIRTDITNEKEREEELSRALADGVAARQIAEERAAELVALAEELSKARDEANQANEAKSEFLATMSHEIRTPMTSVIGFADLLLVQHLPEETRRYVTYIKESARNLLRIINDILDMSKLDAGTVELENIDFNLKELVSEIAEMFAEKISADDEKELDIVVELSDNFPTAAHSDPTRIRQILINLVSNAIKFTKTGYVSIGGELLNQDCRQATLRFTVRDTGIGIKEDILPHLFSNFTQADSSITRRFGGTGLGLAICKKLVTILGGEIGAESKYGKGSTFWFTLPYVTATSDIMEGNKTVNITEQFTTRRALHILAVDDNDINRQIISGFLHQLGHTYELAENGKKALEILEKRDFDLVLMDVRMPIMSGPDATKIIRSWEGEKGRIPIIALTADAMAEHKKNYIASGMDDVVEKPIALSALVLAINAALKQEVHVPFRNTERGSEHTKSPRPSNPEGKTALEDFLRSLPVSMDMEE